MVIAMVLFTVFKQFDGRTTAGAGYVGYSDFLDEVKAQRIKSATIAEGPGGTEITAVTVDDRRLRTTATFLDRGLVGDLLANDVKFDVKPREEGSLLMTLLVSWGPMLLLIGVWVYFMRQMQGAFFLALSNMSRTRDAPTPTNISTKSEPEIEKNGTLASPAMLLANSVLPVPGGPTSSKPRGIRPPSF